VIFHGAAMKLADFIIGWLFYYSDERMGQ